MEQQQYRPSIFSATIRAFFKTIAVTIGIGLGLALIIALLGFGGVDELERKTQYKVLPNAEGVRSSLGTTEPVILKIDINGVIGLGELTTEKMRTLLTESRETPFNNDRIKAILLHVNSPGGISFDAMNIYRMLKEYKERHDIPVIAYVDGLCTSGSLMIAVAADKIVAAEGSIIGSVGVITNTFFNASELIKKYDIEAQTISKGINKDPMNPWRAWKEDEAAPIQNLVNYHYDIFVNLVAENRPLLNKEKLINEYGANVFPAEQAVDLGYIDATGFDYSDALQLTVEAAGLKDKTYHVAGISTKLWISDFLNESSPIIQGKVTHQFQMHPDLHPSMMNKFLYLYIPGMTQ